VDWIILVRNRDKQQAAAKVAVGLQFKYAETDDNFVIFFSDFKLRNFEALP
jgi:hypothetical protein